MAETTTSADICARYHISRQTLRAWRNDPTFPEPLEWHPRRGGTWDREAVATWRKRKQDNRHNRRKNALRAYARRAGETGHLSAVADAFGVHVATLRRWVVDAGLELPRKPGR